MVVVAPLHPAAGSVESECLCSPVKRMPAKRATDHTAHDCESVTYATVYFKVARKMFASANIRRATFENSYVSSANSQPSMVVVGVRLTVNVLACWSHLAALAVGMLSR